MFSIIQQILNFNSGSQYTSTLDQYTYACCCGLILILTVVTCDWLRTLFKALINKIR